MLQVMVYQRKPSWVGRSDLFGSKVAGLYLKFTWMSGRGDRLLEIDEADSKLLTVLKLSWDSKLRATSNERVRS